jgi:hypothetical protein
MILEGKTSSTEYEYKTISGALLIFRSAENSNITNTMTSKSTDLNANDNQTSELTVILQNRNALIGICFIL